jgi:hypothetical protein
MQIMLLRLGIALLGLGLISLMMALASYDRFQHGGVLTFDQNMMRDDMRFLAFLIFSGLSFTAGAIGLTASAVLEAKKPG